MFICKSTFTNAISFKCCVVLWILMAFGSFRVSAQTLMPFATEKTLSLYVGTSLNLCHEFSTDNMGPSPAYLYNHQTLQPGLAVLLSYAWYKDLGDWLFGSFHFTAGIQQDRFSATFQRTSDATLETFSVKQTFLNATVAYRLGVEITKQWQCFLGLGPYLRFPIKNSLSIWRFDSGVEAELGVYYLINSNLCCSFLARYDILPFGSLFGDTQAVFANGAYLNSKGRALTFMVGVGYRY